MRAYYVPDLDTVSIEIHESPETYHVTRELPGNVFMDVDKDGTPLMINIKEASNKYPREILEEIPVWDNK